MRVYPRRACATLHRKLIISLAARHRLPAVYPNSYFVIDGGLISYGPNQIDQYRPSRRLRRPHPQGREAGRPAGASADQVRTGDQPQDRQGARPRRAGDRARARRRGDRMSAPAASWCDPAGGSPAQVRGSARLAVSVAWPLATVVTKRTQRLHGVWD